MKKRIIQIGIIIGIVIILGGLWNWFFWTPLGTLVKGPGFEGIIVNPIKVTGDEEELSKTWLPTRKDILALEKDLSEWVKKNPRRVTERIRSDFKKYRRQYFGTTEYGHLIIYVKMHHPKSNVSRHDWLRQPITAAGGGDYFWIVRYDPKEKESIYYWISGPM